MIAVFLVAVFVLFSMMPILEVNRVRRGSKAMLSVGAELHADSGLRDYYAHIGFETNLEPSAAVRSDDEIPPWIRPLAGNVKNIPTDTAIRFVSLDNDTEIAELCRLHHKFPNLERISLYGPRLTPAGLSRMAKSSSDFPRLESIHLGNVALPVHCLQSFRRIRTLWLFDEGRRLHLSPEHLHDITEMPQLEVLLIMGYDVSDTDVNNLSNGHNLKHMTLWNTNVTDSGEKRLLSIIPECTILRN